MRLRTVCLLTLFLACVRPAFAAGDVTFNNQVVRLLQQHCQTCHRPGSIAPFSLLNYQDARTHAFEMLKAVQSGEMPPWKPVNAHGVFEGERTLTDQEIATITNWVAAGVPEGNPADLPEPITFPETWSAGTPDLVVQPAAPYPIAQGQDDIYRCFPLAVNSQSDLYVRGYEVLPGNRAIVHHVLIFVDSTGQSDALDAADPGPGYTCFGGAGFVLGLGGLGGWVPGAGPEVFPLGTGIRIPARARIVIQVHYSTAEASKLNLGPLEPDLTRLGLYLSPKPLAAISFLPVVNTSFTIPPGQSQYAVKASFPIFGTVELTAIAPHMHLLGRKVSVVARFPDGSSRELIRIDDWDFHWQANYVFKEPIILPAGTIVESTAIYDNSTGNPKNPSNPPVAVSWGERTTDEMALTFLSIKSPGIPSMNTVPFSLTDRGTESVVTLGTASSTMQTGYARVTDSTDAAPSGLAIIGNRQNGILISEAGVPASGLITKGRIFGEISSTVRSGVAITNPNAETVALNFIFTDESGKDVFFNGYFLQPNTQFAAFLDEPPFNGPFKGSSPFSGSFTFTASKGVAAVALRGLLNERSDYLQTTLPVVDVSSEATSTAPVAFPYFADGAGWTTTFMLVNGTNSAMSGTLQFVDQDGKPLSSQDYSIPSHSAKRFSTSGQGNVLRTGAVRVVPSAGSVTPAGSLVFSYSVGGIRITEAGVSLAPSGTTFRTYVEASETIQSGIAITNTSSSTATVRLELLDLNGAAISTTTLTLAANAVFPKFLNQISGFQTLSLPIQGLLRITSTTPIAVVGLRSRINERGDFLITTTPPVSETTPAAPELYFPHFVDAGGYTTQFIMFSAGARSPVNGTIRFFSRFGDPLDLKLK